jgi:hypothetical protein
MEGGALGEHGPQAHKDQWTELRGKGGGSAARGVFANAWDPADLYNYCTSIRLGVQTMTNILTTKLEAFAPLSDEDRRVLNGMFESQSIRQVGPRQDLVKEGDAPTHVQLILEGFACRYKMLRDGTRQIVAYLVPGDFCDLHAFILRAMDHTIATLSPCTVIQIPSRQMLELTERPSIARAL